MLQTPMLAHQLSSQKKVDSKNPSFQTPEMRMCLCILDCCMLHSPLIIDPIHGGDMQHGGGNMRHRGSFIGSVSTNWTEVTL